MSRNISQIYTDNPLTTIGPNDLSYIGVSPYGLSNDGAILFSNLLNNIFNYRISSYESFGLGNGSTLTLMDSDFIGGMYALSNPCPNLIFLNCTTTSGNSLQLPSAQGADAFGLYQGPMIVNIGSERVNIVSYLGIPQTPSVVPSNYHFLLTDNSTTGGTWNAIGNVTSVNGSNSDVIVSLQSAYNNSTSPEITGTLTFSDGGTDTVDIFPSGSNSIFSVSSTTLGSIPFPILTSTQETTLISSLTSADAGLFDYNATNGILTYFDGSQAQNVMSIQKLNAGANITLDKSVPGQVTVSASGGGSGPPVAYSSLSIQNNSVATTFAAMNTFYPIYLGTVISGNDSSDFTNQFMTIGGSSTPVMTCNSSITQFYNVTVNLGMRGAVPGASAYVASLYIIQSGGTIVPTQYRGLLTLSDLISFYDLSITGNVQLSTGDSLYVAVQNITNTNSMYAAYASYSIINMAGSIQNTDGLPQGTSNLWLSTNGGANYQNVTGLPVTVGNLASFSTTGGQLSDSGLDIISSSTVTLDFPSGTPATYTFPNGTSTLADNQGGNAMGTWSIDITGNAGSSLESTSVATNSTSTNANYYVPLLTATSGFQSLLLSTGMTFNPSTNVLRATGLNLSGIANNNLVATNGSHDLVSGGSIPTGLNSTVTITTSTQSMSLQTRYVNNYSGGQMVGTLPTATGSGKTIELVSLTTSSTSGWVINATGSDKIEFDGTLGAAAGSLTSTSGSNIDCATLIDVAANLWLVYPALGLNLTVA